MRRFHSILLFAILSQVVLSCASVKTVSFEPDKETVLRNPLNGWVLYLERNWDETFWDKTGYDHIVTSTGDTVKVSDYANTVYVRTSWRAFEPEEGKYAWTDPDSRRTYPWGHEDHQLIKFHKDMIRIHKSHDALMKGSLVLLHSEYKCISYGRFTRKEAVVVILNNDYTDKELHIHIRHLGVPNNRIMKRIMLTTEDGYETDVKAEITQNNQMTVIMPRLSAAVYVCEL